MNSSGSTPTIRCAVLSGFGEVCGELGLQADVLLTAAGIVPDWATDPERRMPLKQFGDLLAQSIHRSRRDDLPLLLSRHVALARRGPITWLLATQSRAIQALTLASRHLHLHNEALHVWLDESGDPIPLRLEYFLGDQAYAAPLTLFSMGVSFESMRELIGPDWRPQRITLRQGRPAAAAARFEAWFGGPVRFGAAFDSMVCARADLMRPNQLATAEAVARMRSELAALRSSRPEQTLIDVRRLIWALLPGGDCGAARIANLLGMNRRTLHRHLEPAGGYFAVLGAIREELALRHLALGRRTLSDIADLLGFASLSDFTVWFSRRMGEPPGRWRSRMTTLPEKDS